MDEVLVQFDEPFSGPEGALYIAQIFASAANNGLWEGGIQFISFRGGNPFRSKIGTEQLSKSDLRYWAAGLGRQKIAEHLRFAITNGENLSQLPTTSDRLVMDFNEVNAASSLINPFDAIQNGERFLRLLLESLNAAQLKDIIALHAIPDYDFAYSIRSYEESMIERIVAAAQQRVGTVPRPISKGISLP